MVYIAAMIGVLAASAAVGTTNAHPGYFRAGKAWFYIVLLAIACMVSRGLAKSGSREHHNGSWRPRGRQDMSHLVPGTAQPVRPS